MPELPEIYCISCQMDSELKGKKMLDVEVRQEKCLNMPVSDFRSFLFEKRIKAVISRGKWIFVKLVPDVYFLLNLGMGGNILYHKHGEPLPEKYQLKFTFEDSTMLTISFWWFGYAHAVSEDNLLDHKMVGKLGVSPLNDTEFNYDEFCTLLKKKKMSFVKSLLINQENIAGIGNVYIHDILFKAGLHPKRKVKDISSYECKVLYKSIIENLTKAIELGGLAYERDLYNKPGRFHDFLVGYRENQPCIVCGTSIQKIKTGSTSSYVCPKCQV